MKLLILLSLIFSISCIRKKLPPPTIEQGPALLKTSKGVFVVDQKVFYSDGIDSYCRFPNIEEAAEEVKKKNKDNRFDVLPADTEPLEMTFVGDCLGSLFKKN